MKFEFPEYLPLTHRNFINSALQYLREDARILGVAAAGSYLTGNMDEFSDLDLLVVSEPDKQDEVLRDRTKIARKLGTYLAGFTGEHVGEPRLFIALYGPPLLHVDLKFVALTDVHIRVEEPAVIWQRDERVSTVIMKGHGVYPQPDIKWIDDRFWIWVHYAAVKIGRGEIFEAIDTINFLRSSVLGPLALSGVKARPQGVRRLETSAPDFSVALQKTIPAYAKSDCLEALFVSIKLYQNLRSDYPLLTLNTSVERAVLKYVAEIQTHLRVHY